MAKAKKQKAKAKKPRTPPKKAKAAAEPTPMHAGIKKEYLKKKNACKVTFRFPKIAAPDAKSVSIAGDFNDWNIYASRMKKLKNGDFTITLELEPGKDYQFRYLVDETKWENDWNADKYVKSPFGDSDNSVVAV